MQASFTSMGGRPTALRPDVDVVLSLKNSLYKSVMFDCFVRLGGKDTHQNNDAEKETAREALRVFGARCSGAEHRIGAAGGGGEVVRFFKPESRYASRSFVEVDEAAALESECQFLTSLFTSFLSSSRAILSLFIICPPYINGIRDHVVFVMCPSLGKSFRATLTKL
jgi:hypothetical protein